MFPARAFCAANPFAHRHFIAPNLLPPPHTPQTTTHRSFGQALEGDPTVKKWLGQLLFNIANGGGDQGVGSGVQLA